LKLNLIKLLVLISLVSDVFAQGVTVMRNDGAATASYVLGNGDKRPSSLAVDSNGRLFINPGTAATSLGKAVASGSSLYAPGDTAVAGAAWIQNTLAQGSGESDGRYGVLKRNVQGGLFIAGSQVEDAVAVNADAGLFALSVANESAANTAANGDYVQQSATMAGQVLGIPMYNSNVLNSRQLGREEDAVASSGDAGTPILGVQRANDNNAAGDGDYANITLGMRGEVITALASPNTIFPTVALGACTSPITGTADTTVKAAVASNRIYVTGMDCSNTSAVSSLVYIKDATNIIYVGHVPTASAGGSWNKTFPVPLRLASATALNVAMATTATSTTCCATGYVSAN
jgi:hypothetical protein